MANGLINLQTDLTSLKYSSMPLGSAAPYITKNIGQAPGSQIGMEIQHRLDDTSRIAQMLVDKPGIKYLLHEAELQQIGIANKIKNRGNKSIVGAVLGQLGNTLVGTAKILGSTLAQVPVDGTGLHFLKGFRTDTYLQPTNGNTFSAFAQFFGAGGVEGAPLALQGKEIVGKVTTQFVGNRNQVISPKGDDPKFTYNAPIKQDGDQGTNWNEKPNRQPIDPTRSESAREYSKNGKPIPVTTSDPVPATGINSDTGQVTTIPGLFQPNPLNPKDTTLTSGSIGRSNDTTGTVTSGEIDIKPFEQSGYETKRKSKLRTEDNIANALTGSVITLSGSIETTATPGIKTKQNLILGSKSNKDVVADLGDNGVDGKQKYSASKPFTGKDSAYNITQALKGSNSIPTGGTVPRQDSDGLSERQRAGKTYTNKFTYDYEQQHRKVNPNKPSRDVVRERRVGLGDQGRYTKASTPYWTPATALEWDALNMIDVSGKNIDGAGAARDFAKLNFELITPDNSTFLYFRSFIDSIDDGYTADWQAHKYVGRAENFYTYAGFDRDITISFKIAAATRNEMKPLYRKMVYLASATAPTYGGSDSKFMRGTVARITVGSYFDQVPGVITSVKYNLIDGTPWEIAMGQPEGVETDVQVLPMVMQCSVAFKPIHDFAPQTGFYHYFTNSHEGVKFFEQGEQVARA